MRVVSIGNDVVDLSCLEPSPHPRFITRVCTFEERKRIGSSLSKLMAHWAAKEATYKALVREDSALVFSPIEFEFFPDQSLVSHRGKRIACKVAEAAGYVSALTCTDENLLNSGKIVTWLEQGNGASQSEEVRTRARAHIARLTAVPVSSVLISHCRAENGKRSSKIDRIPRVYINGDETEHLLSLSHDGDLLFGAFLQSDTPLSFSHEINGP